MELLTELSTWLTAALTTLVMSALKLLLGIKDRSFEALTGRLQEVDNAIVAALKPFQPVMVALIGAVLLLLEGTITGTAVPPAQVIADAPAVTVLAILLRELWVRFVKPVLPVSPGV